VRRHVGEGIEKAPIFVQEAGARRTYLGTDAGCLLHELRWRPKTMISAGLIQGSNQNRAISYEPCRRMEVALNLGTRANTVKLGKGDGSQRSSAFCAQPPL
jgi:hypothetical protein